MFLPFDPDQISSHKHTVTNFQQRKKKKKKKENVQV